MDLVYQSRSDKVLDIIELQAGLNILKVIRTTIDIITGISLMFFSKSIASRILKDEKKAPTDPEMPEWEFE